MISQNNILVPTRNKLHLHLQLSSRNAADRQPRGRDKAATQAKHQPAPPHRKGRDKTARGYTYDLRQDLDSRVGHTISIYGSGARASTRDDGYLFGRDKPSHTRAETANGLCQRYAIVWPNIEVPHTLFA